MVLCSQCIHNKVCYQKESYKDTYDRVNGHSKFKIDVKCPDYLGIYEVGINKIYADGYKSLLNDLKVVFKK